MGTHIVAILYTCVSCVLYETVWDINKILAQDQWHLNSIADSRSGDNLSV